MRLDRVEIKNFRSIKDIKISFDPTCRVLVGINESGKTNILRALSFLSKDYKPVSKDDLREALRNESPVTESFVRFVFKFEKVESDQLFDNTSQKILASAKNPEIALQGTKNIPLKAFCLERTEGLYQVNVMTEIKSFMYWTVSGYKLLSGWKKPSSACPADYKVVVDDVEVLLNTKKLVRTADFPNIPLEYLADANVEDLKNLVGEGIISLVKDNLPDALFWEYDEDNLLPNSIKIDDFIANPYTCEPLLNMFILGGIAYDQIKTSVESARNRSTNQFQNYLDGIADKTTTHFREIWKEYKDIEFSLKLNADQIIPGVKEENTHDFKRRSDGFKRFVTFLLLISADVKTDNMANTLLLIDEPEVGLHPSGARYLRDELIRISKKNYVVYTTHSIFMIDSGDIGRHYLVKKKSEITTIEDAKSSNIADEEVLFNALGHSVFAVLKENSIIFEGSHDKRLFQVAIASASATLKTKFRDMGICHAKGVGTIKTITPMIELANRACMIISDGDAAAKQEQKLYRAAKGYGEWKTYQDVDATIEAITGEDFVKNDFITLQVNIAVSGSGMPTFLASVLPADKNKIPAISKWLTDNGMTQEQAKDKVLQIKSLIFENLQSRNIEAGYTKLLDGINFV